MELAASLLPTVNRSTDGPFGNVESRYANIPIQFSADTEIDANAPLATKFLQAAAGGHIQAMIELLKLPRSTIDIVVPTTATPGELFQYTGDDGHSISMTCPAEAIPGQTKLCVNIEGGIPGGLDINYVQGSSGRTAISLAAESGYAATMTLLVNAGAELNKQDLLGNTALFYAVFNTNMNCVKVLIAANANLEVKSLNSWSTPYSIACDQAQKYRRSQPVVAERYWAIARELSTAGACRVAHNWTTNETFCCCCLW